MADKFPALRGKTRQDFTGEVKNSGVKNNKPFGKKLRDISPKKQASGLKGDIVNPHSDGDWQQTNGLDKMASMHNIQKFDLHIGDGVDGEPFNVVRGNAKHPAPDVGFKNSPEHIRRMKGLQEDKEDDEGAKEKDEEIKDLADDLEDHEEDEIKNESKVDRILAVLEDFFDSKWDSVEQIDEISREKEEAYIDGVEKEGKDNNYSYSPRKKKNRLAGIDRVVNRQETRMNKEEVELDEISRTKLSDYMGKAAHQARTSRPGSKKFAKRYTGLHTAAVKAGLSRHEKPKVAVSEEVDQLDELSPETLRDYKDKAFVDQHRGLRDKPLTDDVRKRYSKRGKGIEMARAKLRKEEVELDEISRATLGRYIGKAPAKEFGRFPEKGEKDRSRGVSLALRKKWGDKEYGTEEPRVKATNEETIDEISKETVQSYLDKSRGQPSIVPKQDKRPFVKALQARTSKRFQGRRRAQERLDAHRHEAELDREQDDRGSNFKKLDK